MPSATYDALTQYASRAGQDHNGCDMLILPGKWRDGSDTVLSPLTRDELELDPSYCLALINDVSRGDSADAANVTATDFGNAVCFFAQADIGALDELIFHYGQTERREPPYAPRSQGRYPPIKNFQWVPAEPTLSHAAYSRALQGLGEWVCYGKPLTNAARLELTTLFPDIVPRLHAAGYHI